MDWIYTAISWILLNWHSLWDQLLPDGRFLATNWDWILAIIFLVVTVRIILFPLFVKQIKSQRAMQALAPQVKALQEKHKGDRETLQKEMMELYRKEKANPLMGCLPMFLQIPVFFGLFHVLKRVRPENNRTDLYGWTTEQFRSASQAELFGAPIWGTFTNGTTTVKIVAGVLVAIMIATTFLTSRQMILKTGWSEDPNQKMIQRLMLYGIPASLLISGGIFPIGVVIYWVVQNLFSMGQQFWVLRKYPPPKMPTKSAVAGKAGTTRSTPARRTDTTRSLPARRPGTGKAIPSRASGGKAAIDRTNATRKPAAKGDPAGEPVIDGKAFAPKPGAKPTNPKKGGPKAKRPAP